MNSAYFCARLLAVAVVSGVSLSAAAAPVSGQGTWETSLQARDWSGNGVGVDAYYDPFLNITWLADANAGAGSAFDDGFSSTDGFMTFNSANAWASSLTLFGGDDWRLPTVTPVDDTTTFNIGFSNDGTTDIGRAARGVGWGEDSEMGYMFYVHLGHATFASLSNTGPFANLTDSSYWTNKAVPQQLAWRFSFFTGIQEYVFEANAHRAWAVHSGDLIGPPAAPVPAPVPLPGAALLLGSALVGVGARIRRR